MPDTTINILITIALIIASGFIFSELRAYVHRRQRSSDIRRSHRLEMSAREPGLNDLVEPRKLAALSSRERQIARLASLGLSNKEIADRTQLRVSTVATHLRNIFGKLDVHSRVELSRYAPYLADVAVDAKFGPHAAD